MRTLILDSTYRPVRIVSWEKAMILFLTGKAEVVNEYQEITIRSVNNNFKLPKILRLFGRHKGELKVRFTRTNVFVRDNFQCQYCSIKMPGHQLTFDHVIPISKAGKTNWENVVTCCPGCNHRKGCRLPHEAHMQLIKRPGRPRWSPHLVLRIKEDDPIEWWHWVGPQKLVS